MDKLCQKQTRKALKLWDQTKHNVLNKIFLLSYLSPFRSNRYFNKKVVCTMW